jgi:aryl-phospho-beta-D-glucosidase BglC (GH1 family)
MRRTPSLKRGTNFSHWLVRSVERLRALGSYEDFARLAGYGADHLRLPVDYQLLEIDRPPYGLRSEGLACVDRAVEWARRAGLSLVIDLHTGPGMSFMTPEANRLWTDATQQRPTRLRIFQSDF